jgi:hypothetical protein
MTPYFARKAATALLFALALGGSAHASPICNRLSFELATFSEQKVPTAEARKYARAIIEQKQSLRALGQTMRESGCSSGSMTIIGGPNAQECSRLETKKARMERNLEILEAKRVSLMSSARSGMERQRLVDALSENRCNEEPLLVSTPGDDGSEPLVRTDPDGFETIRVPSTEPNYNDSQFVDLGGAAANGSFRTMCVRTCDGAYFPVSSHASTLNFRRDAQVCSMMCPGNETELYYHSIHGESASMRSTTTGRSYEDLPNAYRFRTSKPGDTKECGCNFALYYQEMMRREAFVNNPDSMPAKQSSIVWLKPELRGQLKKPADIAASARKPEERDYKPSDRIRVIGPQFLPDKGIDFTKPLPGATQ